MACAALFCSFLALVGIIELIPGVGGVFAYLWTIVFAIVAFLCAVNVVRS